MVKAFDLINEFADLKNKFDSIREENQHYFLRDMERLIKRIHSAKLNGIDINGMRKAREYSSEHTDTYLNNVAGLEEYLFENVEAEITLGMAATILLYSDTYGCDVTSIKRNKKGIATKVGVRRRKFQRSADWTDGECVIQDGFFGDEEFFTLRRNGGWFAVGQPKKSGSVRLAMGYRRTYQDPSF